MHGINLWHNEESEREEILAHLNSGRVLHHNRILNECLSVLAAVNQTTAAFIGENCELQLVRSWIGAGWSIAAVWIRVMAF